MVFQREPVLRKELSKVKMPNRIFTFSTRIWSPQNWVIMQHTYEGTEIIPTVMKDTPIVDSKRHIADQAVCMLHLAEARTTVLILGCVFAVFPAIIPL